MDNLLLDIFEGKDITAQKPHVVAERGIVRTFQLDRIFHDLTVIQNLVAASHLYARIGFWEATFNTSSYRKKDADTWEHALKILHFLGLEDKKDEIAQNLSHGHQKMLGIAIAMAANPKLLLLDEPFSALDNHTKKQIMREMKVIHKQFDVTIIMVTHNFSEVYYLADKVAIINGGKIIQVNDMDVVFNKPKNKFVAQFTGMENIFNANDIKKKLPNIILEEQFLAFS